ncbi:MULTISPECIES: BaiN/RdsA family NAD(P)/FAD-dependent oxidoreductase [Mesonia]|uniref:Ferredoxin--NADP reductase n=1 Tax=Mesonia oceanica TaxID=2687242 RepID=A0AC61YB27_9FLAO|nr:MULTISPECIES: NAD(P)/FAD-dependent oxidoreductase [Mesonia]MAN27816.1 aminoacetone oxidase family FAD-binding enzyme [Mesonia sp.]MAQ40996.1 aminoacetone oxidase family FAD-binding enzyme [Mesonia sp.]MBJ96464.1 aminoacetone oxidase family FAD-binding enzyme [Flavobacteriaceae bacterium]VVV01088.1 Ferredoxin--NADP reductase [Mesonia oceanica]|tara:strand:+ start:82143 stop:83375 length:1233 start_codon:yes stop_codon:yes gene_type:complete
MVQQREILIIGGGAAGFFTAINLAETKENLKITILERGKEVLTKVKISGGGRCNVTHAEFIPQELSKNYPRGEKELLGPFHQFMTGDTIAWFEERGIELKTEEDGRMFPITDSSETIIDCFLAETERLGIEIKTSHSVQNIEKHEKNWLVKTSKGDFSAEKIVIATGSNPKIWKLLEQLGHQIIQPVPSLFTFNIQDHRIKDLAGISTFAHIKILDEKLESDGPLLITHWGLSGPGILKLSAWGARILEARNYHFKIQVNWLGYTTSEEVIEQLKKLKIEFAKQQLTTYAQFNLPKRLWLSLLNATKIPETQKWAGLSKRQMLQLARELTECQLTVNGKSTFKEEFVTAGGVDLKEVNFKTFESKIEPKLYLAGEVLNIDAITGGFNFQNAWTGGFLAAQAISKSIEDED